MPEQQEEDKDGADIDMQETFQKSLFECYQQNEDEHPEYIAREMALKLHIIDDSIYMSVNTHGNNIPSKSQLSMDCPIQWRSIVLDPASLDLCYSLN
ncbi:hypothetical protein LPJ64_006337 [Coemansia asiatica]|uniref:Uncharacterized protein n=1 Tax=Coemansia asiatica TaxID=1052880 RepID=A0A9W7XCP5_9FUNG|nr:hypothetical protein LPJ64_006337 [Coemansia asiatica]